MDMKRRSFLSIGALLATTVFFGAPYLPQSWNMDSTAQAQAVKKPNILGDDVVNQMMNATAR
jgi:hypothetical protein